jgi:DNA end-binding protein Ku
MGTLLRYPYEVRAEDEYFDEIQDVKVTKDVLDLAKHPASSNEGSHETACYLPHGLQCGRSDAPQPLAA